jgi:D-sedoheptulose 7-phosphate isomerase
MEEQNYIEGRMNHIYHYILDHIHIVERLPLSQVEQVLDVLREARFKGSQIFTMGNGGSASTASHFVCDLAKNTRKEGLPPFRVYGLADNIPILMAYGNDEGYENVFAQQLINLVRPGDVVIAFSCSGNSPNVIKAVEAAKVYGAKTIGFTGFDGGKLGNLVDINICIPSASLEQIEDIHLMLEHMICSALREDTEHFSFAEQMYASVE